MRQARSGKLLRIHISEADRWKGKPLHEAVVEKCRELKIAGATVLAGLEGYGSTAEMHKSHLLHSNRPITILSVDTPENIERLVSAVAEMLDTGLIVSSDVEITRIEAGVQDRSI